MAKQGQLTKKTKEQKDLVFPQAMKEGTKPKPIPRMALGGRFACLLVFFANPSHWPPSHVTKLTMGQPSYCE